MDRGGKGNKLGGTGGGGAGGTLLCWQVATLSLHALPSILDRELASSLYKRNPWTHLNKLLSMVLNLANIQSLETKQLCIWVRASDSGCFEVKNGYSMT